MKRSILKFYDKLIIVAFLVIFTFSDCIAQKKVSQKSTVKKETTAKKDTISTQKDTTVQKDTTIIKKNPRQVIAMYGVRVDKYKVKDVK